MKAAGETRHQPFTAAELRGYMAELEAEKQKLLDMKRSKAENAMRDVAEEFTRGHLTHEELEEVRRKIRHAVDHGMFEVMVMRFPSSLCSDKGRAVNNALPNWPETLPRKAHELYLTWEKVAKPAGYHLRAYILDFPNGMPGDVGIFLNWAA
ncbi:histidine kinase [Poseidonocella sp. HB161398]|uniref:histidine kinase n=1 Tax=Poseidonocella sp. HB161398 TaxID=2320855 RepID=UPI0014864097|nr:histidine kinase [Poseidonocella sp. HB161398]